MNLRNIKGFIAGFTVAAALFGVIGANDTYASTIRTNIEVFYNDIKLFVNGERVVSTDVQGNIVEPFIYNGTTYLPVRAVAEAVGLPVNWDANTYTVHLGEKKDERTVIGITELTPWEQRGNLSGKYVEISQAWDDSGKFIMQQKEYISSNTLTTTYSRDAGAIEYLLHGDYSRLTGLFGVDDRSRLGTTAPYKSAEIAIYGDDKLLYENTVARGEAPIEVDVDLIGVEKLKIHIGKPKAWDGTTYTNFIDVKLHRINTK